MKKRLFRLLALCADVILGEPAIRWRDQGSPFGPVAAGVVRPPDPQRYPRSGGVNP